MKTELTRVNKNRMDNDDGFVSITLKSETETIEQTDTPEQRWTSKHSLSLFIGKLGIPVNQRIRQITIK